MPPKLMGDPKSWRKFVVALLPHNCCYERHSDDHIKHILENVLHLSSDGATPRNKSVFTRLDMTDVKSIQDRMKEDEKVGLARKKQQAADEVKATAARAKATAEKIAIEKKRAAEVEKKSKHMSRAQREKMKADSEKRMHDLEASLVEPPSLEEDPLGITASLANLRAPPSPVRGAESKDSSASSSSSSSAGSVPQAVPATEEEGAADVIYVLSLADVVANFFKKLPPGADRTEAGMESLPEAILSSLSSLLTSDRNALHCLLELTSHRPVRSGWINPASPVIDIQAGIGPRVTKATALLWADVTVVRVQTDLPTLRPRPLPDVVSSVVRRLGDAAVDRYLYDEWLSSATMVGDFPAKDEHRIAASLAGEHYQSLSSQLPCEAAASVVTICDLLVESVTRACTSIAPVDVERMLAEGDVDDTSVLGMWSLMDGERRSAGGDDSGMIGSRRNLLRVVYHGDEASSRLETFSIGESMVGGRRLASITKHMLEDCSRVPGGRGRAGMPRVPTKSESERGAELNELLTFLHSSSGNEEGGGENGENGENGEMNGENGENGEGAVPVTPEELSHTRMVNLFQDVLSREDPSGGKIWRDNRALHRRRFRERLGPTTLSQVMSRAMSECDTVLTTYDGNTDTILVACHTRTWERRRNTTKFVTSDTTTGYCSVPPGFARWRDTRERRLRAKVQASRVKLEELREKARLSKEKKDPSFAEQEARAIAASSTRTSSLSAPVLFQMGKDEANAVEDEIVSLYPADNAVVRIYRMGIKGGREKYRWASVSKDGHTFGLRPRTGVVPVHLGLKGVPDAAEAVAAAGKKKKKGGGVVDDTQVFSVGFDDGSRCVVEEGPLAPLKPDGHGTVTLTYTDECTGLVVECCSDGSCRQRVVGHGTDVAREEVCRVVTSQGQVVRYLVSGGVEILMSDGNVCRWMVREGGEEGTAPLPGWVVTNTGGERTRAVPRPLTEEEMKKKRKGGGGEEMKLTKEEWRKQWRYMVESPPIVSSMTTDTLVLSKVVVRNDGTRIITETDGTRRVEHHDGTVIMVQAGGDPDDRSNEEDWGFVTVRCPGYATVEIDIDVAMNADTHASGGRIALTKGGLQERSVVTMEDGSSVVVSYNTKFTATVNGAVKLVKPNGVEVVAHDDLTVQMSTGDLQSAMEEARREAAASTVISEGRSEKDLTAGAYFADLKKGHLWSADPEHNELELVLPPVDAKAVNDPLTPPPLTEKEEEAAKKNKKKKNKNKKKGGGPLDNFGGGDSDDDEPKAWELADMEPLPSEGAEIKFALSGESVEGVQAPASINAPIEPRLFVLRGDGFGYELCRDADVEEYQRGLHVLRSKTDMTGKNIYNVPMGAPRIEIFSEEDPDERRPGVGAGAGGTVSPTTATKAAIAATSVLGTTGLSFGKAQVHVVSCNLTARKEALFTAAGLERDSEPSLPLTLKKKSEPMLEQRRAILVRNMVEIQPQSIEAIIAVDEAEKECERWRDDRDSNQGRFDVADPRSREAIEAERSNSAAIVACRERAAAALNGDKGSGDDKESKTSLRRSRKNNMNEAKRTSPPSPSSPSSPTEEMSNVDDQAGGSVVVNDVSNGMESAMSVVNKEETRRENDEPRGEEENRVFQVMEEEREGEGEGEGDVYDGGDSSILLPSYPKAPLPSPVRGGGGRNNLLQYTSSSRGGNVIGLSEEVRNAQGMGGFWRDQNPDISAPTSKQVETSSGMDEASINAVLDRNDDVGHLIPSKLLGKPILKPIGSEISPEVMVAGSGRNMARTLREGSSSVAKFAHPSPFSNTMQNSKVSVGFDVQPERLMVGDLCSGGIYKCSLTVTNKGHSLGRFRVAQRGKASAAVSNEPGCDSLSHRMRVVYKPGALAAGMKRKLEVEIAALGLQEGGSFDVDDYVEVVANDQVIRVPVYGKVVDATKHDPRRVGKQATLISTVAL